MRILVAGAGGFIGHHLVARLRENGHYVRGVDLKRPEWSESAANEFRVADLRRWPDAMAACEGMDWVFALAATMGGMGFISHAHAEIIRDNTLININTIESARLAHVKRYLFTSSACVYPNYLQTEGQRHALSENDVYPAQPQEMYGWEKLHTEHLCQAYREAGWLDTRVVRFHNCCGPEGSWNDGKEKAPAAMCRKVAEAALNDNPRVEIWGDGQQVRSYMWIGDCLAGLLKLMESDHAEPLNLGRDRCVTVDKMVDIIAGIAGIEVEKVHIEGPEGVRWRNSDNSNCRDVLGWEPTTPLESGLVPTYRWIEEQAWKAAGI